MSWVRELVKKLGGKMTVQFREAALIDFRIRFPQEEK